MKICNKCGAQNEDNAQFCTGCGVAMSGAVSTMPPTPPAQPPKEKKKALKVLLIIVAVFIALIIFASLIGGDDEEAEPSDTNTVSQADSVQEDNGEEESEKETEEETTKYSEVETFSINGTGDSLADGLVVKSGCGRIHFTHKGDSNFIVQAYGESGTPLLLINTIGNYDGTVLLPEAGTYDLEIQADGAWTAEASGLSTTQSTSFSGSGDLVTDIFSVSNNKWTISNKNASSNFVVYEYSTLFGFDLLVNEIGNYEGSVRSSISDGNAYFVVMSDGDWSIQPAE